MIFILTIICSFFFFTAANRPRHFSELEILGYSIVFAILALLITVSTATFLPPKDVMDRTEDKSGNVKMQPSEKKIWILAGIIAGVLLIGGWVLMADSAREFVGD